MWASAPPTTYLSDLLSLFPFNPMMIHSGGFWPFRVGIISSSSILLSIFLSHTHIDLKNVKQTQGQYEADYITGAGLWDLVWATFQEVFEGWVRWAHRVGEAAGGRQVPLCKGQTSCQKLFQGSRESTIVDWVWGGGSTSAVCVDPSQTSQLLFHRFRKK